MTNTHFEEFVRDALNTDPGSDKGLNCEEIYGLYTSWCLLTSCPQESAEALWAALSGKGIVPGRNTLAMAGPAAADYILASAPGLI